MEGVSDRDFALYKDVLAGCYRFHDLMLGRLIELAGDDATIILCSDHGFHCDHLRPVETPSEPAGPAVWHREYGIVVMAGPGIKQGERIHGASLLDITPTALALMGQPIGNDMDGKPLVQAFTDSTWVQRIDSWETVEGDCGMHPRDQREDPFEARQAIRQLVELGYIDEPDKDEERAAANAEREAKYNLARAYLDGGLLDEATNLLSDLYTAQPDELRFGMALAKCHLTRGQHDEARRLAEQLICRADRHRLARADAAEQRAQHIETHRDEILQRAEQAATKRANGSGQSLHVRVTAESLAAAQQQLTDAAHRLREYDVRISPAANMLLGAIELADRNPRKAMEHLRTAELAEPRLPGLHLQLGQTYLRLRENDDAVRAFERALGIDPDNAQAHEGLAAALARLGRNEQAADHALSAVELMHDMPRAHLRLGVTLARLGLFTQAAEAFETCLKLAPMTAIAHRYLARLYAAKLDDPAKSAAHRLKAQQIAEWRRSRSVSV
jgi:tetratricopeptide (TPR) repeat protein